MLVNLCLIGIAALLLNGLFEKIKLPGLIGMTLLGIVIGPNVFNLIDGQILEISKELRTFALIVILLRAGLGLKKKALNQVGISAIRMSFIPGVLEGLAVTFMSMVLLDMTFVQGGILGFIIAAVSPAVVVPQMLRLKEEGIGEQKQVPTLILAGASVDDVFAITIFTAFLTIYLGKEIDLTKQLLTIPISILFGVASGMIIGYLLYILFRRLHIRDTKKVMILLIICILYNQFEGVLPINTLLGIMAIGFILLEKAPTVANRLAGKMNKVWIFAEILLFVLIGAQLNPQIALGAGLKGIIILGIGLLFRSIGVILSLLGSDLDYKERLFCVIAYIPKATVQAAIGAIPLSLGVASGELMLAIAVLAILITAPIGSFAIRFTAPRLLTKQPSS